MTMAWIYVLLFTAVTAVLANVNFRTEKMPLGRFSMAGCVGQGRAWFGGGFVTDGDGASSATALVYSYDFEEASSGTIMVHG